MNFQDFFVDVNAERNALSLLQKVSEGYIHLDGLTNY